MTTQSSVQLPNIRYVKGIGPKRALAFERLGIRTLHDLVYFFPRRYEDRTCLKLIEALQPGDAVTVKGEILSVALKRARRMPILEVLIGDSSGMILAVWFNQPYLKNQFLQGQQIILFGKVELFKNRLQIMSPEYEIMEETEESVHTARITPVYPLTEGLFQRSLRQIMRHVAETQLAQVVQEFLPEDFRKEHRLAELVSAVGEMHFPSSFETLNEARRRIVFDEFLLFEITLLQKIQRMKTKYRSVELKDAGAWQERFKKSLPFKLTHGQETALRDLAHDLSQSFPMNRLLMGDVGSGKTAVAAFAMLLAAKAGHQAVLLVPTEILAIQHFQTLKRMLAPFDLAVKILTASIPSMPKERTIAELAQGKISCVVGTHALLQEDVRFSSLALVVIDEQHKFGVHQRCQLLEKDPRPHQLVMTATPIPRTLALTVYGDLDVSTIKELPAGRQPIQTFWITHQKQTEVLNHILEKTKKGEQAYFIFPLIEETEHSDMLAAKEAYERLNRTVFKDIKTGLVHGRMPPEDRDAVMRNFKDGTVKVLVATSVVEVGVDNPNATIMVIENAERFGLSQLHQMRGRIGRGAKPSECFLFGEPATEDGKKRLRILTKTQDGFIIAEEDLKLRGPGDFWGTRQSGDPLFRVAHPILDVDVLLEARKAAMDLVKNRKLESQDWLRLKNYLDQFPIRY